MTVFARYVSSVEQEFRLSTPRTSVAPAYPYRATSAISDRSACLAIAAEIGKPESPQFRSAAAVTVAAVAMIGVVTGATIATETMIVTTTTTAIMTAAGATITRPPFRALPTEIRTGNSAARRDGSPACALLASPDETAANSIRPSASTTAVCGLLADAPVPSKSGSGTKQTA